MQKVLIGLFMALATQSSAQNSCAPHRNMVILLAERYGEVVIATGTQDGNLIEIFTSPITDTWSITLVSPDGVSCLVATGEDFEAMRFAPLPAGDPT